MGEIGRRRLLQLIGGAGVGAGSSILAPGTAHAAGTAKRPASLQTRLTEAYGITYPIVNAGMAFYATPQLAAAVTNAGGLGFGLNVGDRSRNDRGRGRRARRRREDFLGEMKFGLFCRSFRLDRVRRVRRRLGLVENLRDCRERMVGRVVLRHGRVPRVDTGRAGSLLAVRNDARPKAHPGRHVYAQRGGFLSFHGRCCSNCAARRNSVASSPKRAANIMPSGSPAAFQASGTDIAGCPDMLNMLVPGM